ncbi:hypothetical protein GWI33_008739 [Rhynchophorus ferrugineus]|uniref:Uncharacterized protein n=1 Tax=Rhynchophorus ferrugineus TaxID=354439 RepID=A0A834IBV0_RHYFE|nr:hypothetical protein GWI33_008739 [Rhynchophorus ferrugineus]
MFSDMEPDHLQMIRDLEYEISMEENRERVFEAITVLEKETQFLEKAPALPAELCIDGIPKSHLPHDLWELFMVKDLYKIKADMTGDHIDRVKASQLAFVAKHNFEIWKKNEWNAVIERFVAEYIKIQQLDPERENQEDN